MLVKARKLKELSVQNGLEEIKQLEPIDRVPRMLQAPELTGGLPFHDVEVSVEEVQRGLVIIIPSMSSTCAIPKATARPATTSG